MFNLLILVFNIEQKSGEVITENQLHEILREVDLNKNAQVDLGEFLQVSYVVRLFEDINLMF